MPGREDVFQREMNQGHSHAWDQEWEKAVSSYRSALQEFPDNPKALNSLGLALFESQQYDEALEIYQRVTQFAPSDPIPFERIAQLSERLGNIEVATEAAMQAAEQHLKNRDVEKAVENWVHVTMLNPEHTMARSRLALTHEKLEHTQQAVIEYLAVASLLQRGGKVDKANELVNKALQLAPASMEAKQAQTLLGSGQLLPMPVRPKGGTGPLAMSQVKKMSPSKAQSASSLDPISEASQKALTNLAELLFDYSDESESAQTRRGLSAIVKGTGHLQMQQSEQTKVVLHLGQAIDAQTKNQENTAADELEMALAAGFKHPALYYNLGLLRSKSERSESALRFLGHAVKHVDFSLGARLLIGSLLVDMGRYGEAAVEYLEALKLADAMVVPEASADDIRQLYEPLIESFIAEEDEDKQLQLSKNIQELLVRENWRDHLNKTREQLPKAQEGETPFPIAEIIVQAQSSHVLDAMNKVNQLARQGLVRSAMDEAFHALQYAPTYLPLHTLIGDLLVREGHTQEAISKYAVIATAYDVRGESNLSTKMLRNVINLAPMEMRARRRMIDQLIARGEVNEAINEYLELADIYYRLAELDMARNTYTEALRVVQQSNADRSWNVHILQRMADIDMQRLDWKQALRIFEQIRTLRPDDEIVRKNLVDLNFRLGQSSQAVTELDNFLTHLKTSNKSEQAIAFLEDLVRENEDQVILRQALANQYQQIGQIQESVAQLDNVAEMLINDGKQAEAITIIQQILQLNPANAGDYQKLLAQLQSS